MYVFYIWILSKINVLITLTPLNFEFGKVVIHLYLVNLLNKMLKNSSFDPRGGPGHWSDMKNNVNLSKIQQKNDFLKSRKIAEPQNGAI